MLRWLRRILVAIAILIALAVFVPMAYIEGSCRPALPSRPPPRRHRRCPRSTNKATGANRPAPSSLFRNGTSSLVRGFRPLPRLHPAKASSATSPIPGFWRSFCTINRAVPESGESRFDVKTMIYDRRQLFRRIRRQGVLREHRRPPHRMDQRPGTHATGRLCAQGDAGLRRVSLHHPLVQISVRREAGWPDGDFGADAELDPQLGAQLRARRGIFRQDRIRPADPEGARRRQRRRTTRYHAGGGNAAAGRTGEGAAHQADPQLTPNGSWYRRRATRISPRSSKACSIKAFRLPRSPAITKSSSP